MESATDAVAALLRVCAQTAGLALVFSGTGHLIGRKLRVPDASAPASLRWSAGYFIGLLVFLAAYLVLSRLVGARAALWIALASMAAVTLRELGLAFAAPRAGRWLLAAGLAVLVLLYAITIATVWIYRVAPLDEPDIWTNFGSIHSGRYANYAIAIAQADRVPFLAQNGAQSMLASVHLLLGTDSPLAALMAWIAFSLAFLSVLLYGFFRASGFGVGPCVVAAVAVMFGNTAISSVHVLVSDSGSPLAFIGSADMAIAVATFLLSMLWLRDELGREPPVRRGGWLIPGLLGLTWCWFAPQNLVVALATGLVAVAHLARRRPVRLDRLAWGALAFALGVAVGATQFGALLPGALREDVGAWTQEVGTELSIRPYTQYLPGPWSGIRWNVTQGEARDLYERAWSQALPLGRDAAARNVEWIFEEHLWDALRIYGFPLLGLVLLGTTLPRRASAAHPLDDDLRTWLLLSACAFFAGFLALFAFDLDHIKWWLTRFFVPGWAAALTCLALAGLTRWRESPRMIRVAWALLPVALVFGPVTELASLARQRFLAQAPDDPVGKRLLRLVETKGPFIFHSFRTEPGARAPEGVFAIGPHGAPAPSAIRHPPMPLRAGRYGIGYRIDAGDATPSIELEVFAANGTTIARRRFEPGAFDRRPDGSWAWLPFELASDASAGFRLANRSNAAFKVTDIRLRR